ncbi:hypothetical protein A6U92_02190 [Agrobacterium rubi]|nr:hypothetical protein A6U92_02190 [Agrobacterium rubi]
MIFFKTHQTNVFAADFFNQKLNRVTRVRIIDVIAKYLSKLTCITTSSSFSAFLRISKDFEMKIFDPSGLNLFSQNIFRKPFFAGRRDIPHIDKNIYVLMRENAHEI